MNTKICTITLLAQVIARSYIQSGLLSCGLGSFIGSVIQIERLINRNRWLWCVALGAPEFIEAVEYISLVHICMRNVTVCV